MVKAKQTDTLKGGTVSGAGGAGTTVAGTVDSIVINKTIRAKVDNLKNINASKFKNVDVNSYAKTDYRHGTGSLTGTAKSGIGGAVATLVVNKDAYSDIYNSIISSSGYIKNNSEINTEILAFTMGFGGAGTAAISGCVTTQVLGSNSYSIIDNSQLSSDGIIDNKSKNTNNLDMYMATGDGAGTAAVGGVVYSLVDNTTSNAKIKNKSKILKTTNLTNDAYTDAKYKVRSLNGAGAGTAAVNGAVDTLVLKNKAISEVDDTEIGNSENLSDVQKVNVTAKNITDVTFQTLQGDGAGTAAVNGNVNTIATTKETFAQINKTTANLSSDVKLDAYSKEDIGSTVICAAGAGTAAITGAVTTVISGNKTYARILGDSNIKTTVGGDTESAAHGVILKSQDKIDEFDKYFKQLNYMIFIF